MPCLDLCPVQTPAIAGEVDVGEVPGCRHDRLRQRRPGQFIAPVGQQTADDLVQGLAVAHREGLPLRLAMVGEDDQVVGTIGPLGCGADRSQ